MAHGGKRPNSGRKPNTIKAVRKPIAEAILAGIDENAVWLQIINSGDRRLSFDALRYLTDRRDGKASESFKIGGDKDAPIQVKVIIEHVGASTGSPRTAAA